MKKLQTIPLYVYVAHNNPVGAAEVINYFGLKPPRNEFDLIRGLRHVMVTFGEDGFRQIAKVHPDRNLILDSEETGLTEVEDIKLGCDGNSNCNCDKEKKSNACGCSSSFDGSNVDKADSFYRKSENESISKADVSNEVKKALNEHNSFIKDGLPYIALIGVGAFLFIGMLKR